MTTRDSEEGFNLELKSIRESNLERRCGSVQSVNNSNENRAIIPENPEKTSNVNYIMLSGVDRKSDEFASLISKIEANKNFKMVESLEEVERVLPENESIFNRDGLVQMEPPTPNVFLLVNRYKRSKKLLFSLCRGIPVLSLLKIKAIESHFEAFAGEFRHFFFSSKRHAKMNFEALFEERHKLGKGLLRDYDFILSEDLQNFENIRYLISAAGGQIIKSFNKFNRKGISDLASFLGTFLGHGDPQYVEIPGRRGQGHQNTRKSSKNNIQKMAGPPSPNYSSNLYHRESRVIAENRAVVDRW